MNVYHFDVKDAEQYGVEKAVILYNLRFWLEKNKANGHNEHDGYYWTYNGAEAMTELFPFFKSHKIKRLMQQLEDDGVIISGNYNDNKFDRTKWYTMPQFRVDNIVPSHGTDLSNGVDNCVPSLQIKNTYIKPDKKLNNIEPKTDFSSWPNEPSPEVWEEWKKHKKRKKASASQIVIDRMGKELHRCVSTGMTVDECLLEQIERGWSGFKADWMPKVRNDNLWGAPKQRDKGTYFEDDEIIS